MTPHGWRLALLPVGLFAWLTAAGMPARDATAQPLDPHRIYEQNCASCHAMHAGDLASETLMLVDDKVVGRASGQDLRALLAAGHGRLSEFQAEEIKVHLEIIVRSGQIYRVKCRSCHDRAQLLVRATLKLNEGRLVGRYSERDIERFLAEHGRLHTDEVPILLRALRSHLVAAEMPR